MRNRSIIACMVIALVLLVLGVNHSLNEGDAKRDREEQRWLQFTMEHHCKVAKTPTFGNPNWTWICDGGFEVVRQ